MRIGLFTNNYLPFYGGVTVSVETLRRGLEARGHRVWTFAPRFPGATDEAPRIVRFPSVPAGTYPEFALAVPWAPRFARLVQSLTELGFHPDQGQFNIILAKVKALGDEATFLEVQYAWLPALVACVETWELAGIPSPLTVDNFPATPARSVAELISWLITEISALYKEDVEIPPG